MSQYIQVITTAETEEDANRIAQTLVEKRLAACAQVSGPITSTYWWKGRLETAREWQCVAKSCGALFQRIREAILKVHPYDVPEILALPVTAGSPDYLRWLDEQLAKPGDAESTG